MSTEVRTRREQARRRRSRAFLGAFALVVAVLGVVGLAGAAVTTAQGPRVTHVSVDPDAAVTAAGERVLGIVEPVGGCRADLDLGHGDTLRAAPDIGKVCRFAGAPQSG